MDRQNLFNFLAKDASKPEDRETVSTRWVVYKKWNGSDQKLSELMRVPTRSQLVDGLTKSFTEAFLIKRSDIWNRSAPRWGYESLEAKTTHWHPDI